MERARLHVSERNDLGQNSIGVVHAKQERPPRGTPSPPRTRTRLVLLGTAGGSVYYAEQSRRGVGSAVVIDGSIYLIDCGEGVAARYRQAGLGPPGFTHGLEDLQAVFFSHLHSDHTIGYPGLLVAGFLNGLRNRTEPIQIYGPGPRVSVQDMFADRPANILVNPQNPMPGTADLTRDLLAAYATDLNERALRRGSGANPEASFDARDIQLPAGIEYELGGDPAPEMEPFAVHEDANVRVLATLVDHRPAFPAFGFRFETPDGVIVFSGDTRPTHNVIRLARGADILVHEVIAVPAMERLLVEPAARARLGDIASSHTAADAVGSVASAAGVTKLVLSPVLPPTADDSDFDIVRATFAGEIVVGRDLDQIAVGR